MDDYLHRQRKQPHPYERGSSSSRFHRYLKEFPSQKGHITSDRPKQSSYTDCSQDTQNNITLNSRHPQMSLSTNYSCPPFNPSQPIINPQFGPQTFPYNRGVSPDFSNLLGWNFWNLCFARQPQPDAWYPGLCPVRSHRNSREGLDVAQVFPLNTGAQNTGKQENWQSLTNRSDDKSSTRLPNIYNSHLNSQPKNTDGWSPHTNLATCRRNDDGMRNQAMNNRQLKICDGSKDASGPDMTELLDAFIEKLSLFPVKENSVQTIENCITASRLPIKTSLVVDKTVLQSHLRPVFSGTLCINDVFIAHVTCYGKKLLKHRVYDAALSILKTRSAQDLMAQHDLEQRLQQLPQKTTLAIDKKHLEQAGEEILQELMKNNRRQQISKSPFPITNYEQEVCLNILIQDLKMSAKDGACPVLTIDKKCIQLSMKLLTVYKIVQSPGEQTLITCDLYILDYLIAQGQGTTRKKAQSGAYVKGGDILKQSTGKEVLISFPKFREEELSKPDIFDVVYKGYTKVYESNRCRLNRIKQLPEQKRKISELVIIEHEDWATDRKKHAHCILNQSATQCGCLLEWTIEPAYSCFRCTMRLQGEDISSSVARQRKTSLRMASCIALFRLYETQPVIQGFHLDHPEVWISRDKLMQHLESYPGEAEELPIDQAEGNQEVDKSTARAIEEMLDQFFARETVEELVAAPDWKLEERRLLRTMAIAKGLRVLTDVYCDDRLPVISKKYDLSEMVRVLEMQANKSQGRYRLLPTEERPSYNDIAGEVAANESIIKQCQTSVQVGHYCQSLSKVTETVEENKHEDDTDNDDFLVFSDDDHTFLTANSTFCYSLIKDKVTAEKTTPTQMISYIALPHRTSTPLKSTNDVGTLTVDESKSDWDESSRNKCIAKRLSLTTADCFNGECSELTLKSSVAVQQESLSVACSTECNLKSLSTTSSLSSLTSIAQKQQMKVSVIPLTKILVEDSNQGGTTDLWNLPQVKSQQRKFNKSVDLEAGVIVSNQMCTNQWKHKDKHFTKEEQQQWMEQEY